MTRDEMIRLLVLDRLEHRDELGRYLRLHKVLENGFRGFRNLSDKELMIEIRALGLADEATDRADEGFDELADDQVFDSSLSAGHAFGFELSREYSQ